MEIQSIYSELYGKTFDLFLQGSEAIKNLADPLYPLMFPDKVTTSSNFDVIVGGANKNVMATVTSADSKAPLRSDEALKFLNFKNLILQSSKVRTEDELLKLTDLLARNTDQATLEALDLLFDDVAFVINAVFGRKSSMALQLLSTGKTDFNLVNNPDGLKKIALDYGIGANQKLNAGVDWSTTATSNPAQDFLNAKKQAKALGFVPRIALMNETAFNYMIQSDAMQAIVAGIKYSGELSADFSNFILDLEKINKYLSLQRLATVVIVDDLQNVENNDASIAAVESWATGIVTFVETLEQGVFNNTPTLESTNARYSKNADVAVVEQVTVIQSASTNPPTESTIGKSISGIKWVKSNRVIIMDSEPS